MADEESLVAVGEGGVAAEGSVFADESESVSVDKLVLEEEGVVLAGAAEEGVAEAVEEGVALATEEGVALATEEGVALAAEEGVALAAEEGPHKALLLPNILDLILSKLDSESWKAARQVCRLWSDRALANFHKGGRFGRGRRLNLGFKPDVDYKVIIASVDPRILSSVWLDVVGAGPGAFQALFQRMGSSGTLGGLRALYLLRMDYASLDLFIEVVNDGGLEALTELEIEMITSQNEEEEEPQRQSCRNVVTRPHSLPGLETLRLIIWVTWGMRRPNSTPEEQLRIKAGHLPAAFQSLLSAAPKLIALDTCLAMDLSDRKLRNLRLNRDGIALADERETEWMFGTLNKESLRTLNIDVPLPELQFPLLPNVTCLSVCGYWGPSRQETRNIAPALKHIVAPFDLVTSWIFFPSLLPPTGKLEAIYITSFSDLEEDSDPFRQLFTRLIYSGVAFIHLDFSASSVTEILRVLQTMEGIEWSEGGGSLGSGRVLEFNFRHICDHCACPCTIEEMELLPRCDHADHGHDPQPEREARDERVLVRKFTALLEKLGGRWELVRLFCLKFRATPTWTEMQVPLWGGRKQGLIKIVPDRHPVYATIELTVREQE